MNSYLSLIIMVFVLTLILPGCQYDDGRVGDYYYRTDMHDQPSYKPQESPLPPVEGTVPVTEKPVYIPDSSSADLLNNPIPFTAGVNEQGRKLFNIHCGMCHGPGGKGDGKVAPQFQTPPDITAGRYRDVTDGYIYWVIRDGIGVMPPQYEHVRSHERWLIVNHIRSLQQE